MANKPNRPALAARVDQAIYDLYIAIAIRRVETVSEVVERALIEYAKKTTNLLGGQHDTTTTRVLSSDNAQTGKL